MPLKANFHFHSGEDSRDILSYGFRDAIDRAAALGFEVIAWTPHKEFLLTEKHRRYAESKNILVLGGIEAELGKHKETLIINCGPEAGKLKTFDDLRRYRLANPDILVVAPHPFYPSSHCLGRELEKNIDLFDAIELCWFRTKTVGFNRRAVMAAEKYGRPLLSTSDTHNLEFLDHSYCLVEAEKDAASVVKAIKEGRFENRSRDLSWPEALEFQFYLKTCPYVLKRKIAKLFGKPNPWRNKE